MSHQPILAAAAGLAVLCASAVAGMPAQARSGGDAVRTSGSCSNGPGVWKLKAAPDNRQIDIEFEVDTNRVGQVWHVQITDNGDVVLSRDVTTKAPSGSFTVRPSTANQPGVTDVIRAHAFRGDRVLRRLGTDLAPESSTEEISMVNRLLIGAAGVLAGSLVATPAVLGLSGNSSFSRDIDVRVPSGAHQVRFAEPELPASSPTTPRPRRSELTDDHPRHDVASTEAIDDHGSVRTASDADRDGPRSGGSGGDARGSGDRRSSNSARDDSTSGGSGEDSGGRGDG